VSATLQLHIAVLLFAGTTLFAKLIPLNATDITALRAVIGGIALFALLKVRNNPIKLHDRRDLGIAIILGLLMSVHWITGFAAVQVSTVAIGIISFYVYPVLTVIAEPMLDGKRPHPQDLIGGILALVGVGLMMPLTDLTGNVAQGVMYGVLSAILFTARNLIQKRHFNRYPGSQAMAYQTAIAGVVLIPFVQGPLGPLEMGDWGTIVLLAICFTALPHAMLAQSLRDLSAKTVSLMCCMQPLYATILAAWLLSETPSVQTMIGGSLILLTALFETARAGRG
jgi:drug/metabolite transporter (DMT)-like permease